MEANNRFCFIMPDGDSFLSSQRKANLFSFTMHGGLKFDGSLSVQLSMLNGGSNPSSTMSVNVLGVITLDPISWMGT